MSCFTCCMSPVTCHMSLTLTATDTDPLPANSLTMHSWMVCKDPQIYFFSRGNLRQFLSKIFKFWDQVAFITLDYYPILSGKSWNHCVQRMCLKTNYLIFLLSCETVSKFFCSATMQYVYGTRWYKCEGGGNGFLMAGRFGGRAQHTQLYLSNNQHMKGSLTDSLELIRPSPKGRPLQECPSVVCVLSVVVVIVWD